MDRRKLLLLVGSLIIAIATALMAKNMFTGTPAPPNADSTSRRDDRCSLSPCPVSPNPPR